MDKAALTLLKTHALIDGAWVGEPAMAVTNKATGDVLAHVPDLDIDDTKAAIDAAERAFPAWSKRLAKERSEVLRAWYNLIIEHVEQLALLLSYEQGKPVAEAKGEVLYGASFVEFFAEEAKRVRGETIPSHKPDGRIVVLKQPIGVVAAITPWNFPNAMITRKVSPALAAGCTAVIKPAEETPLSALALAELAQRAGMPKGVLNVVTAADPAAIGRELCTNSKVRLITFTGSTEVGRLLMQQSSSTVKKVALELGGHAPFIVFDDADIDAAVAGAIACKFRAGGQTCVCANRIFVHDKVHDEFSEKLAKAASQLKVGEGTEPSVEIGPLINEAACEKVDRHIADALQKGAKTLSGGGRHARGGTFYQPTVLTGVTPDMRVAQEETFGPVAPIFKFSTDEDVIEQANNTPYGLAAYFYARDIGRIWKVAEALEYGIVGINEGIVSTEVAPFGGVKQSGLGREGSHHGVEEFVEVKYVFMGGL